MPDIEDFLSNLQELAKDAQALGGDREKFLDIIYDFLDQIRIDVEFGSRSLGEMDAIYQFFDMYSSWYKIIEVDVEFRNYESQIWSAYEELVNSILSNPNVPEDFLFNQSSLRINFHRLKTPSWKVIASNEALPIYLIEWSKIVNRGVFYWFKDNPDTPLWKLASLGECIFENDDVVAWLNQNIVDMGEVEQIEPCERKSSRRPSKASKANWAKDLSKKVSPNNNIYTVVSGLFSMYQTTLLFLSKQDPRFFEQYSRAWFSKLENQGYDGISYGIRRIHRLYSILGQPLPETIVSVIFST